MSNGILIVDDNASIRLLLRSYVEGNTPFVVCGEAENGPEAINKARELQPDLVLLDLTLPGMTGTETAKALKELTPKPKIVLFTLHTDGVNKELATVFGIDLVLSKSEGISKLGEQLKALLIPSDDATRLNDPAQPASNLIPGNKLIN
jgi:DNA-binding NarL/FixJ family response regulator